MGERRSALGERSSTLNYTLDWVLSGESDTGDPTYLQKAHVPQPEFWPFVQDGVVTTQRNQEVAAAQERLSMGWVWQDHELSLDAEEQDTVGSSYSPSEGSETLYATDDEHDDVSDIESECKDIMKDRNAGIFISANDKNIISEMRIQNDIDDLEYQLVICQSQYNPDEVVALMKELYEVLIAMAHNEWLPGCISYYPHTESPVDLDYARELGYSESALYIIQCLPYLKAGFDDEEPLVFPRARFTRYTNRNDLQLSLQDTSAHEPWIVPLTWPKFRGIWVVLDTKLGVIKAWEDSYGPSSDTPESRRANYISPVFQVDHSKHPIRAHRWAPCIPAALYLRTLIDAYKDLKIAPNTERPDINAGVHHQQGRVKELYRTCGWPDNFDRAGFQVKLKGMRGDPKRAMDHPRDPMFTVR